MRTPAVLAAVAGLLMVGTAPAQVAVGVSGDGVWSVLDRQPAELAAGQPFARPASFVPVALNYEGMLIKLAMAPWEFTPRAAQPVEIELPRPDGTFGRYRVLRTQTMAPELQARYPHIQSYTGIGVDDPTASVRLDLSDHGLRAMVLSERGAEFIEPFNVGNPNQCVAFSKAGYGAAPGFKCHVDEVVGAGVPRRLPVNLGEPDNYGASLRKYRAAYALTGEFTAQAGGTVSGGLSALNTINNRLTGIYERDLAVRLELVANNNLIIYTNGGTDPFTSPGANGTSLNQVQSTIDSVIGAANYDVGHLLHNAGGGANGVAGQIGNVCVNGNKARGISVASGGITGDPFIVDYVAHELGHQFGGSHTFNNCGGGSASGNPSSVVEPGSGVTIMAYAGLCGSSNIANNSIDTFHAYNLIFEMRPWINARTCQTNITTNNAVPTVVGGPDYTIPIGTPFSLTAIATDGDNDPLTYQWEQNDPRTSGVSPVGGNFPDVGNNPIFRSFLPTSSPERTFPKLSALFSNTVSFGETLPTTTRDIDFLVSVRDNKGGYITDAVRVNSTTVAGPFTVTSDNSANTWSGGGPRLITWNVANTGAAPVSASTVQIDYTTNGGMTWAPIVLSTANDGSETITAPNIATSTLRYRVRPTNNIFFDINNANITVVPTATCYANCDGSTTAPVLNVADFGCFLDKFASGDPYANCDESVGAPVLNVADFGCFLTKFAAGCR